MSKLMSYVRNPKGLLLNEDTVTILKPRRGPSFDHPGFLIFQPSKLG